MVNYWDMPTALNVNGHDYEIRTDYRDILTILTALSDPDLVEPDSDDRERTQVQCLVMLQILYKDFDKIPISDYEEAAQKASEFIDMGLNDDAGKSQIRTMDWQQDAPLIIPAINRVQGREIRALSYMHWWTFLSSYLEIGECLFSEVVQIRLKKAKGKKLEKWEKDFLNENKKIVVLKAKLSETEEAEKRRLEELLKAGD